MTELLFATPHGSHLYGTAHAQSDNDTFEVYENKIGRKRARYAKQSVKEKDDSLKTDLSTFLLYASKGVPQYLEAMYSQKATVDQLGTLYRYSFRPNIYEAEHTYNRTIKALYERGIEENNLKFVRHAWRLHDNRAYIVQGKYFNPTLSTAKLFLIDNIMKTGFKPYMEDEDD